TVVGEGRLRVSSLYKWYEQDFGGSDAGIVEHLRRYAALPLAARLDGRVRIVDAESRAQFAPVRMLRDTPQGVWLAGLPDEVEVIVVGQEYVIDGVAVIATRAEVAP
ncbi:MAG: hypothetical protein ACO2ZK_13365, partial [Gemmobacter sp.]